MADNVLENGLTILQQTKDLLILTEEGKIKLADQIKKEEEINPVPNFLDLVAGNITSSAKLKAASLAERIKIAGALQQTDVDGSSEQLEVQKTPSLDVVVLHTTDTEEELEVAAAKAINYTANSNSQEMIFGNVGLEVEVINNDEDALSLSVEPSFYTAPPEMKKREKAEDKDGYRIRRMNPFAFELSGALPMPGGSFDFVDTEEFNELLKFARLIQAKGLEKAYSLLSKEVDPKVLYLCAYMADNKSRIKELFRARSGQDDKRFAQDFTRRAMTELSAKLGVQPLATCYLHVKLSVEKLHKSKENFTSLSRNVSIFKGEDFNLKVERTRFMVDFNIPIVDGDVKSFESDLFKLEVAFSKWLENEVRSCLGYPEISLSHIKSNPKEVFAKDTLGLEDGIKMETTKKVNQAMNEVVDQLRESSDINKLTNLGQ